MEVLSLGLCKMCACVQNDTLRLLAPDIVPTEMQHSASAIPLNRSFMHLHLGFDATGLDGLELHHILVNSWEGGVDAEQVYAQCFAMHHAVQAGVLQ